METISVRKLTHSNLHIDCDYSIAAELKEFFSFYVPGYRYMPAFKRRVWDGKIRLFDSNSGELPAGLYHHFLRLCKSRDYKVDLVKTKYGLPDDFDKIDPREIYNYSKELNLPWELRDYQFAGISHALKYKRAILLSPTGSGKSLIIYYLIRWYLRDANKKVLVIVPTTSLVEQMYSDFVDYNMPKEMAHKIYSGKEKTDEAKVFISTWQSIYKLPKIWFSQFGAVFGDECHGFKSKSLMNIMNKATEAEYRYGTTGTLDGTQTHELVLQGLFGKTYKVTTTKDLQINEVLAELNIKRVVLNYNKKVRDDFGQKTYREEIDFIVDYEKRNKFIANLTLDQKGNTLLLFNYVERHGKPLFDLINSKVDEKRKVFFVSGNTHTSDREAIRGIVEKQKNAIIVASLGTFSTGINIRNLHNIVFASPSKSQIRVLQSIGRGLRKSDNGKPTKLFDIIDNLCSKPRKNFAMLHADERLKIYEREKFMFNTFEIDL